MSKEFGLFCTDSRGSLIVTMHLGIQYCKGKIILRFSGKTMQCLEYTLLGYLLLILWNLIYNSIKCKSWELCKIILVYKQRHSCLCKFCPTDFELTFFTDSGRMCPHLHIHSNKPVLCLFGFSFKLVVTSYCFRN